MQSYFNIEDALRESNELNLAQEENLLLSDSLEDDSLLRDLESLENVASSGNATFYTPESSPKSTESFFDDAESIHQLPSIMESEIDIFEGVTFADEDFKDPQLLQFDVNGVQCADPNQANFLEEVESCSSDFPMLDFSGNSCSEDYYSEEGEEEKIQLKEEKKGKKRGRKPGKKQQAKKSKTEIKEEEYLPTRETPTKKSKSSSNKKADEKYLKRLIANKKSAQASRERKKALRMKLEESLTTMTEENSQLSDEIKKLEKENEELKAQFTNLRNLIRESSILTAKVDPSETAKIQFPKEIKAEPAELLKLSEGTTPASNAASVYLMVILYSFSQHFKNGGINANSIPNFSAIQGILNQNHVSSPVMV